MNDNDTFLVIMGSFLFGGAAGLTLYSLTGEGAAAPVVGFCVMMGLMSFSGVRRTKDT